MILACAIGWALLLAVSVGLAQVHVGDYGTTPLDLVCIVNGWTIAGAVGWTVLAWRLGARRGPHELAVWVLGGVVLVVLAAFIGKALWLPGSEAYSARPALLAWTPVSLLLAAANLRPPARPAPTARKWFVVYAGILAVFTVGFAVPRAAVSMLDTRFRTEVAYKEGDIATYRQAFWQQWTTGELDWLGRYDTLASISPVSTSCRRALFESNAGLAAKLAGELQQAQELLASCAQAGCDPKRVGECEDSLTHLAAIRARVADDVVASILSNHLELHNWLAVTTEGMVVNGRPLSEPWQTTLAQECAQWRDLDARFDVQLVFAPGMPMIAVHDVVRELRELDARKIQVIVGTPPESVGLDVVVSAPANGPGGVVGEPGERWQDVARRLVERRQQHPSTAALLVPMRGR